MDQKKGRQLRFILNAIISVPNLFIPQSAGAVKYTDCFSASPNECPIYDTKQSDSDVPVMLELWGMRSIPSLPLLPGPLWPRMVVPDSALSMG